MQIHSHMWMWSREVVRDTSRHTNKSVFVKPLKKLRQFINFYFSLLRKLCFISAKFRLPLCLCLCERDGDWRVCMRNIILAVLKSVRNERESTKKYFSTKFFMKFHSLSKIICFRKVALHVETHGDIIACKSLPRNNKSNSTWHKSLIMGATSN